MKKLLATLVATCVAATMLSTVVSAVEYVDMPDDYSTASLEAAVENGLLTGYGDEISPNDNLTRAQMASILVRALNADNSADISAYTDVSGDSWYYSAMSQAVYAKLFMGDGENLNPDAYITRQEVCAVLTRAFSLSATSDDALDAYVDQSEVSSWAVSSVSAMVEADYMHGTDTGELNPLDNITRKDFAVLMDNMVETYITEAGTITELSDGSVVVNVPGVTLKNMTITGNLIIGDGVGEGEVTLNNVVVEGSLVVRGGGENSVIITGNSSVGTVIVAKVDGMVRIYTTSGAEVEAIVVDDGVDTVTIEGDFGTLHVASDYTPVVVKSATMDTIVVSANSSTVVLESGASVSNLAVTGEDSYVQVNLGATSDTVILTETAVNSIVEIIEGAEVTNIVTAAADTTIINNGTVSSLSVAEGATTTYIMGESASTDIYVVATNTEDLTVHTEESYAAELAAAEAEAEAMRAAAELAAAEAALEVAETLEDAETLAEAQATVEAAAAAATQAEESATALRDTADSAKSSDTITSVVESVVNDTVTVPSVSDVLVDAEEPDDSTETSSGGGGGGGGSTSDDSSDDSDDSASITCLDDYFDAMFGSKYEEYIDDAYTLDADTNLITLKMDKSVLAGVTLGDFMGQINDIINGDMRFDLIADIEDTSDEDAAGLTAETDFTLVVSMELDFFNANESSTYNKASAYASAKSRLESSNFDVTNYLPDKFKDYFDKAFDDEYIAEVLSAADISITISTTEDNSVSYDVVFEFVGEF